MSLTSINQFNLLSFQKALISFVDRLLQVWKIFHVNIDATTSIGSSILKVADHNVILTPELVPFDVNVEANMNRAIPNALFLGSFMLGRSQVNVELLQK